MVAFTLLHLDDPVAHRLVERWCGASSATGRSCRSAERERSRRLARATLRALLERAFPEEGWSFFADDRGKPFVQARSGTMAPAISWSHSGKWIACALADRPLGIDVEVHKERDYSRLSEYAFGPRENNLVQRAGGPAFYRIWTVREAIAKATGGGLPCVTDRRDRAHDGPSEGRWAAPASNGGTWLLAHEHPRLEMSLAIALRVESSADWTVESFDRIAPADLL